MFQFGRFPSCNYWFITGFMILHHKGFPIRTPTDRGLFTAPRGFSQLVASFIGSWCQGIRPMLFIAWTFSSFSFSLAWVSQIIVRLLILFRNLWKSFFLWLCLPPFSGKIVVNTTFSERPNYLLIYLFFLLNYLFVSFILIQFSMTIARTTFGSSGGLKWTRTTDLALIRRAL